MNLYKLDIIPNSKQIHATHVVLIAQPTLVYQDPERFRLDVRFWFVSVETRRIMNKQKVKKLSKIDLVTCLLSLSLKKPLSTLTVITIRIKETTPQQQRVSKYLLSLRAF